MACSTCASLKCFESCYNQFNVMKQSDQVLQEANSILLNFSHQQKIDSSSLSKFFNTIKSDENKCFIFKNGNNNFTQLIIDYVFSCERESNNSEENADLSKYNKEKIVEILSILRFESIDRNFFYHYLFKKESQNNLIREDKIIYLLKLFNVNTIESILSIPSFSFIHSNYLSNCEFVNFFKAILSSSLTNDFTSLYQSIYQYLVDQDELGELTKDQFIEFMKKTFSINENFVNKRTDIGHFEDIIRRIIQFSLLASPEENSINLDLSEFNEIFQISCKFINFKLKNEIFDIAYKRKDLYFSGKVTNRDALMILDELSIVYTKLNKEKVANMINNIEISYFDLLSIVSDQIDLSELI